VVRHCSSVLTKKSFYVLTCCHRSSVLTIDRSVYAVYARIMHELQVAEAVMTAIEDIGQFDIIGRSVAHCYAQHT
jgi:hypothetical protein